MRHTDIVKKIKKKFNLASPHLNERTRRIWAAIEAKALGHGGITILSSATNLSRSTIHLGLDELESKRKIDVEKIRKPGGGRKKIIEKDKTLLGDLGLSHK